jgi:hypothetical protein
MVNDWLEFPYLSSDGYKTTVYAYFKDKSLAVFKVAKTLTRHDGFWMIDHESPIGGRSMGILPADQVQYFTTYDEVSEDTDEHSGDHGV